MSDVREDRVRTVETSTRRYDPLDPAAPDPVRSTVPPLVDDPIDERGSYGRPVLYVIVAALALVVLWVVVSSLSGGGGTVNAPATPETPALTDQAVPGPAVDPVTDATTVDTAPTPAPGPDPNPQPSPNTAPAQP